MKLKHFIPEEYWTIKADFVKGKEQFEGPFYSLNGDRAELKTRKM